jgi:hypothetical protein
LKNVTALRGQEEEVDHLERTTTSRGQTRNMTILKNLQPKG